MFFPEGQIRVFVYGRPVSMRLSYDGLYALAVSSGCKLIHSSD